MQNQFVDLYRNGIKTAADVAKMSLENSVRLQEKQLGMVRTILEENTRSAERLSQANSIEDLFALQSRLATAQLGRVAEFWSSLWQAAAENQKAWIGEAQSQARGFDVRESGSVAQHERKNQEPHRKSA